VTEDAGARYKREFFSPASRGAYMSEFIDQTIALNVRLKPSESSAHPRVMDYMNVGTAQGIAYVDFGFIEPAMLAAIVKTAKNGQAAPKGLDGSLVTRARLGTGRW
jgi:hypothetical protein